MGADADRSAGRCPSGPRDTCRNPINSLHHAVAFRRDLRCGRASLRGRNLVHRPSRRKEHGDSSEADRLSLEHREAREAGKVAISVVRLGTPRSRGEGPRLGTVRRPPRGVLKTEYASRDFYDVWLPELAPSEELVKVALGASDGRTWQTFVRRYRAEMKRAPAARLLPLLAALSHQAAFSVGCYCANEARCHRSVLKALLVEHGARLG